jgi:thioredoxin-dependent peroxiredoxin
MKPRVGDKAPSFNVASTAGRTVALEDYRGKWLVVYFYPKAFTPGCTRETIQFQKAYDQIRALGAEIVGVSHDAVSTQCSFADKHAVTFPLLADTAHEMSRSYAVVRPLLPLARRITYVIDPDQMIRAIFHHEIRIDKHLEDVLQFLSQSVTKS